MDGAPSSKEHIASRLVAGMRAAEVAARLHYSRSYVFAVQARLREDGRLPPRRTGAPPRGGYLPWTPPEGRAAALARGRALALAKVAAGAWVAPARPQQRTKGVVA